MMDDTRQDAGGPEPVLPQGSATEPVPTQGSATEPVPTQGSDVVQTEAVTEAVALAEPVPQKPKRRLSSGKLFAGALALGVLGGVGTGYAIQASRPATPLPPLAGTQPKYAPSGVYQGIAPAALPASQDDATRTDGDLTKLLLPKPSGASDTDSTWTDQMIDVAQDAFLCDNDQSQCYVTDYDDGVEAVADTEWTTSDGFFVEIRMFRFRPGESTSAHNWEQDGSGSGSTSIPTPTGIEASGDEYRDSYGDNADHIYAEHGDILISCWVSSPSKIPNPALIDSVVTQQMARL